MMTMKGTFAAVVMTLVLMGVTEGGPVSQNTTEMTTVTFQVTTETTTAMPQNRTACPRLLFVAKDGDCEFVNQKVKAKVTAELNKRFLTNPSATCPYCASGVYDAYPDWDDCEQLNYCLNGRIISLKCKDLGFRYFNPATKACEMFDNPQNMCLHRLVSLLTIGVQG